MTAGRCSPLALTTSALVTGVMLLAQSPALNASPKPPASGARPRSAPTQPTAPDPAPATIGHLKFRDRSVTVKATTRGLRYTVRDKEGRTLHENLPAQELRARVPDLYRLITDSVADARVRMHDGAGPR
jgi:hypothetical protein